MKAILKYPGGKWRNTDINEPLVRANVAELAAEVKINTMAALNERIAI